MERAGTLVEISLAIITFNEDALDRCLASAAEVGEIIVVDSCSTDKTPETALGHGARVLERPFVRAARQKSRTIGFADRRWVRLLRLSRRGAGRRPEGALNEMLVIEGTTAELRELASAERTVLGWSV